MPINLSKGQKVDLTKGNPGLKNIMVGLGWDVNAFDSGVDFDLGTLLRVPVHGKAFLIIQFIQQRIRKLAWYIPVRTKDHHIDRQPC